MGKRPRTPHFITGIGDGNVHNTRGGGGGDDATSHHHHHHHQQQQQQQLRGGPNIPQQQQNDLDTNKGEGNAKSNTDANPYSGRYHHLLDNHQQGGGGGGGSIIDRYSSLRSSSSQSNNERLQRLEEPLSWGSNPLVGDESKDGNDMMLNAGNGFYSFGTAGATGGFGDGGPWQVSAFAFLGMVVVISVIFLHFVSESGSDGSSSSTASSTTNSGVGPYHYRRRQRQRRKHQMRKKKTDEWSDDEEPIQDGAGLLPGNTHSSLLMGNPSAILGGAAAGTPLPGETSYDSSDFDYYENSNIHNSLSSAHMYPYYYQQQQQEQQQQQQQQNNPTSYSNRFETQDSRLRKTSSSSSAVSPGSGNRNRSANSGSNYAMPSVGTGLVPTYKSPAPNMLGLAPRVPARGISPMDSYSSNNSGSHASNYGSSPGMQRSTIDLSFATNAAPTAAPMSGRLRVPSTPEAKDVFQTNTSDTRSSAHGGSGNHSASATSTSLLPPPPEESPLLIPKATTVEDRHLLGPPTPVRYQVDGTGGFSTPRATKKGMDLKVRPLTSSNSSSFDSLVYCHNEASGGRQADSDGDDVKRSGGEDGKAPSSFDYQNQFVDPSSERSDDSSFHYSSKHNQSLTLSPGNAYEETPVIGNVRRVLDATALESPGLGTPNLQTPMMNSALLPPVVRADEQHGQKANNVIPFMPSLGSGSSEDGGSREKRAVPEQPRSILMDELRLVQMETGSMHWEVQGGHLSLEHENVEASEGSFFDKPFETEKLNFDQNEQEATLGSEEGSDISIPSGDPRKGIIHKRSNLTMSTDSATSLQSSINFSELRLQEVVGGGGFGQVWRASWRGTPVAVKVLTGSAQNTHIAKAILEEFKAEINLLKGMRHPNICLYMGACLDPPNRAIITELAANGSVWDALRLPLMPPYVVADGSSNGSWPMRLYIPGQHGAPPSSGAAKISAPIPPRGTWPWELVKRVSCGAARGMAYLHSGNPPVLHRDLKSANLLLDESYTTKVCDFGLSRLKAQARSMTGNCGTVQWMAPEVLANHDYDEKADVFSFGIIVWELLTRECPFEGMTAIQCALAVLNRDKRPEIPKWCPPGLHALIKSCVKKDPSLRPSFEQIILALDAMD